MKLSTKPLRAALSELAAVIKTRTTLPTLQFIRLSCGDDDKLLIEATNGDAFTSRKVDFAEGFPPVLVSWDRLADFAACATTETIELLPFEEGKRMALTEVGTNRKRVINILPPSQFAAEMPGADPIGVGVNCADLADGLEAVNWAASKDNTADSYKLATLVELLPNSMACVATSGTIVAVFSKPAICETRDIKLPATLVPLIIKDLREAGAVASVRGGFLCVTHSRGSAAIKMSECVTVPYRKLTSQRGNPQEVMGCPVAIEPLRRCCSEARALAGVAEFAAITANREDEVLKIFTKGEHGTYNDSIDLLGGDDVKMKVPALDLDNALKRVGAEEVNIVSKPNAVFIESGDMLFALSQCVDLPAPTKEAK